MNWYKWDSVKSFNLWHADIKTKLGLPKESVDASGDVVGEAITTDSYTSHFVISKSDIRAMVELEHADGLTESENPFPSRYE
jgi:hypothetical protein